MVKHGDIDADEVQAVRDAESPDETPTSTGERAPDADKFLRMRHYELK